jgi:hypothetical protein
MKKKQQQQGEKDKKEESKHVILGKNSLLSGVISHVSPECL